MRRLRRSLGKNLEALVGSETGATIIFVAVTLVALLALTAFAVDFGRMYEERRQLQNGADAAAVAIAEDCARGLCDASYDEYAVADIYVDANARDGSAEAWFIDLDLNAQTVTVHNRTEDELGNNDFNMLLAGAVGFDGLTVGAKATVAWGYSGDPIVTLPLIISDCEWDRPYPDGPDGHLPLPPPPDPPLPPPPPSNIFPEPKLTANPPLVPWAEVPPDHTFPPWWAPVASETFPTPATITFHNGAETSDCAAQAGQDIDGDNKLPGGFGWLETDNDGECAAKLYGVDDDWVAADPGVSGPTDGCLDILEQALINTPVGGIVQIPYFNDFWEGPANGSGPCGNSGKCYHIAGYGALHIVGYKLIPSSARSNFVFNPPGGPESPIDPAGPIDPPLKPNGQPWPQNQWVDKFDCVPATSGTDEVCLITYFIEYTDTGGSGTIGGGGRGITVIKFID